MTFALLVVAALTLVPGLGAALALAPPGGMAIETRLALVFALGYGLVAGVATVLALAHVFLLPTFVVGVALATAVVWVVALRRGSVREHAAALSRQFREAPFIVGTGLGFLLAFAVSRLFYPIESSLGIRSSWRYWADGLEVAAAGHVPPETGQWGIELPTTVSKLVLNAFEGGVSFVLGPGPFAPMNAILIFTAIGVVAALLALGRELGLGIFAPLVPVLVVLVPKGFPLAQEITTDLRYYTGEGMGRLGAFGALLIGMYALRASRGRGLALVAGALLAVAGLTHLVPTLIGGLLLGLYALTLIALKRNSVKRVLGVGLVVTAAFGVLYVGMLGLSGGDLGLQRATSGASFQEFPPDVDPTRSFLHGRYIEESAKEGSFLIPPREILGRYGAEAIDRPTSGRYGLLLLAFLAAATVAMVVVNPPFIPLAVLAWGLAAVSLIVALLFSYRYETLIPANFGVRRLYDYVALVPALVVPALLETAARPLVRGRAAVATALTVAVGVLAVGAAAARVPTDRSLPEAAAGVKMFRSVAEVVPCDVRMLANARTAGSWQSWTGRRAITEGMSPYLRPRTMERVLPILVGGHEFFADPQANRDFLESQRVEYLVVVEPDVTFGTGGTVQHLTPEGLASIEALPDVELVYQDERVSVFTVGADGADPGGGHPARCDL
jgi:hypothetical protein